MEHLLKEIFTWICAQSDVSPFFLFGLLLLSGLCIPVSEDLIIVMGGLIASHCINHDQFIPLLFFLLWLGSLLSAWEAYWIGRFFGPRLFSLPLIKYYLKPKHIVKSEELLQKYGIYSFLVGRFFPGGVRNALFMTCGYTRMPFHTFIWRDFIAGTLTTTLLFSFGYIFGQNIDQIFKYIKEIDTVALIIAALLVGFLVFRRFFSKGE